MGEDSSPRAQSAAQQLPQDEDVEAAPKSLAAQQRVSFFSRAYALGPVEKKHADLLLLAQSVSTGMIDAASFSNWAVFCGMQTGNTIILGLSTATTSDRHNSNPHAWLTTLVSILSYLAGVFFTFRLTSAVAPGGAASNRLYLTFLLGAQSVLSLVSAALVTADVVPHNPAGEAVASAGPSSSVLGDRRIASLLPPLAFAAGMQIATSRLLGFNEIPVNVITSTFADIMGDARLLSRANVKRNRRVASVVLLLGGAIASAWIMRSSGGMGAALFVAGGIKAFVALAAFVALRSDVQVD